MADGRAIAGGAAAPPALSTGATAPVGQMTPPTAASTNASAGSPSNPPVPGDPLRELMEIETSAFGIPVWPGVIGAVGRYDQYEILGLIGRGGMGAVYLAVDTVTSARVAVKVLTREWARHPAAVRRFLEEASRMARLSHRSVLPVLSVSPDPDVPYYVMRYVEQGSLSRRLRPGVPLETALLFGVSTAVAEALAAVHNQGLVHRDVKPANVLVDGDGHAYLADFGLSRDFLHDGPAGIGAGRFEGTAPYLSPLTASGKAEDTRADIYSFGAMLYEMLTGSPPYVGSVDAILRQIREGPPESILFRNPAAPRGLVVVAEGAMARELRDRYARMEDVVEDLKRVAAGQLPRGPHDAVGAGVVGGPGALRGLARAGSKRGIATAAVAALLATAVAWSGWAAGRKALPGTVLSGMRSGTVVPRPPGVSPAPARPAAAGAPADSAPADSSPGAVRQFNGHSGPVTCAAFSPDGTRAVSGGEDQTVRLWEVGTGSELRTFKSGDASPTSHAGQVTGVAFSPDGHKVVSCGEDPLVRVWDADTGTLLGALDRGFVAHADPEEARSYQCAAFSPDGRRVIAVETGKASAVVRVWNLATGLQQQGFLIASDASPGHHVDSIRLSPDGRYVALCLYQDNRLRFWNTATEKELPAFTRAQGEPCCFAFSADGRYGVERCTATDPSLMRVWHVGSGREMRQVLLARYSLAAQLALSRDGRLVVAAGFDSREGEDCALRVWDVRTCKLLWQSPHLNAPVHAVAVSPDGRFALASGDDMVLRLWRLPAPAAP